MKQTFSISPESSIANYRRGHSPRELVVVFARIPLLVSLLCILCLSIRTQDWKAAHQGVEHAQVVHKIGADPVQINLLRLDLTKVRLDVQHALDQAVGVEKTSSIASRHRGVAATNAGFFRLDKSAFAGDAAGTFMVDGHLLSESSNNRINLVLDNGRNETSLDFGHYSTFVSFGFERTQGVIPISGINRERKTGEIVLYNSQFGKLTRTRTAAAEVIFSNCDGGQTKLGVRAVRCRAVDIRTGLANSAIPDRGFVVSIDEAAASNMALLNKAFASFLRRKEKHRPFLRFILRDESTDVVLAVDENTDIVAGVPKLIKNGKIEITWEQEKAGRSFVETRHPRTAVAKLKEGKFLMITVDGRQPGVSVGMTLQELADYLLSLGAVDAMNLDGGGSTTMFLDGKVVNTPSDKEGERKVGDALVVTLRKRK